MASYRYEIDPRLDMMLNLIRCRLSDQNKVLVPANEQNTNNAVENYTLNMDTQVYEEAINNINDINIDTHYVTVRDLTCKQALKNVGTVAKLNNNNNDNCCIICIEDFKPNEFVRVLQCHHQFHKKCIDKWLYLQFRADEELLCPLCQQDTRPIDQQNIS